MRLFVGVPIPAQAVAAFASVAPQLAAVPSARLVPEGTHHVTLRFMGEVFQEQELVAALDGALRGRPALPCVVEGLGAFPNPKQARILWAGVRAPGIEQLAAAVEDATQAFGQPPERRRFVAHVTLARLAKSADVRSLLARHTDTLFGTGNLDRVVLFDSVTGPAGPRHEVVREWRLGEA